jgi:hypothetical protein
MNKSHHDTRPLLSLNGVRIIVNKAARPVGRRIKDAELMTQDIMEAPQPTRSRAVFSPEDFGLIRTAIAHYLREVQDQPESVKYANLYHRLGRVA